MPAVPKTCQHCDKPLLGRWFVITPGGDQLCLLKHNGRSVTTCDRITWTLIPGKCRLFDNHGALVSEGVSQTEKVYTLPAGNKAATISPLVGQQVRVDRALQQRSLLRPPVTIDVQRAIKDVMQKELEARIMSPGQALGIDVECFKGTYLGIERSTTPAFKSTMPKTPVEDTQLKQIEAYKALLREWGKL